MPSFKSHPIFYSTLIALGVIAAAEGWLIYQQSAAAEKSAAALAAKRRDLASLRGTDPFPSEENKGAVEADLERSRKLLAAMRDELKGRSPIAEQLRTAQVPAAPIDMFFNLTTFVEQMRTAAREAEIQLGNDERFGFATYSAAGPERELIPQVFRQRQVLQYLLEALIAADPDALVSVQRERPAATGAVATPAAGSAAARTQTNKDIFEIDPRITARVPGFIDAMAFRLTFEGKTDALRDFLNKISTFELPLVVRSVEVEPARSGPSRPSSAPGSALANALGGTPAPIPTPAAGAAKPLVESNPSKFTVTVEFIDLASPATSDEATPTS